MTDNPCILIVYSTFGDGHVQAAKAIRQALAAQGVKRVHLVDLLAEAHPYWNAVSRFTYLHSSVYFPRLYGFSYDVTNQTKPDPQLSRMFHSIGKRKLTEIINRLRPDAVIHTFPYLAMSEISGKAGLGIPTFTILTDYVLHSRWVHPDTDRYFVATGQLKQSLMTAGIEAARITVSGIPIREAFSKPLNKTELVAKLGLDSAKKYVLISAGAYGVQSQVRKMIQTVLDDSDFDILLICGKNRKLLDKMESLYRSELRIKVMGFVEQMEEWMAVSSCLLTKAGGITLTEALSLSLPVIVYRPLPGQEKGNAEVLTDMGVVYTANDTKELSDRLRQLGQGPSRKRMARAIKTLCRPEASHTIISEVMMTISKSKERSDALQWRTN